MVPVAWTCIFRVGRSALFLFLFYINSAYKQSHKICQGGGGGNDPLHGTAKQSDFSNEKVHIKFIY